MTFDRWTRKYLHRLLFGQFLKTAAEWLGAFLLSFGTIVLLVKLTIPSMWPHVLWLGLAAIPVAIGAWKFSMRDAFTKGESVAYLDQKLKAGGLLMSLSEAPDEEWARKLPQMESQWSQSLPKFYPVRFAKTVGIPLLFCIACGFVPLREIPLLEELAQESVAEANVEDLKAIMEQLEEEQILEEEEKEQIAQEIEQLLEEKNQPLTHEKWETVDALRQKMQMRIDQSTMSMAKAASAAETLSQAGDLDNLTEEQIKQLTEQLSSGLQRLSEKGNPGSKTAGTLSPEMQERLKQMMANGQLSLPKDPAERQKLLNELKEALQQESQRLVELRQKCQNGQCPGGQCEGNQMGQGNKLANGNKPGKGGVNRGRGDADLNYGHETDEQGIKFKETVLPKGYLDDPSEEVLRVTFSPPEVDVADSAPKSAARKSDASTGQATWNRKLSPKHRGVVKEYFNSGE
ncbi:MAG: hypothetical protein HUJ26_11155 [Planctomycetaceae bacterium]|nr:hypothetical protein [Planctomycetaceae bacterium]